MNQLRLWLESHLPSLFRPAETTVHVDIAGVDLTLRDWQGSNVLAIVPKEILDDDYKLQQIEFRPGDVVVDIGANIGIVAIYLAKTHRKDFCATCLRRFRSSGLPTRRRRCSITKRRQPQPSA